MSAANRRDTASITLFRFCHRGLKGQPLTQVMTSDVSEICNLIDGLRLPVWAGPHLARCLYVTHFGQPTHRLSNFFIGTHTILRFFEAV